MRSAVNEQLDALPRVDLRIPGPWQSHEAFLNAVARKAPAYSFEGERLIHTPTGRRFQWSATPHDDDLAGVFAGGGGGRISKKDVQRIAAHVAKVHVSGPGGSVEAMRELMQVAGAIVRAGGLGVMVDNSGATHTPSDWIKLAEDEDPIGGCYWASVSVTAPRGGGEAFSVGMHCLGLRDVELEFPPGVDRRQIGMMLHEFNGYALQSGAVLLDGDPIGDENGPQFRVRAMPCTRVPPESPFFNPYGVWRLEAMV
jgi:hypothetical protein